MQLKDVLIGQGIWSQYLEVGIGPDAEIFTKCPPLASVGTGAEVGIHPKSEWNNPEPEVVLAVTPSGRVAGASLGNDVNLRDFEGRSALLLGKAKDNNASCAIGPFIRLFDETFSLDDVRRCELALNIRGTDGFEFTGRSSMAEISRDPLEIVGHTIGPHHQYPDGVMLFLGTMFAPTVDRFAPARASPISSAISSPSRRRSWARSSTASITLTRSRRGRSGSARSWSIWGRGDRRLPVTSDQSSASGLATGTGN